MTAGARRTEVSFRAARASDLPALLALYRQLNTDDPILDADRAAAVYEEIASHPGVTLFVLERHGKLVASTYLNVMPNLSRAARPYAVIENVVVEDGLRGIGLGKRIMADTLQAAWDAGCYKVMLLTSSRRPSTHAFYRACGFDPDAKTAYLARPSDQPGPTPMTSDTHTTPPPADAG